MKHFIVCIDSSDTYLSRTSRSISARCAQVSAILYIIELFQIDFLS